MKLFLAIYLKISWCQICEKKCLFRWTWLNQKASKQTNMQKKVEIIDLSKDDSDEMPNLTDFSASSEI